MRLFKGSGVALITPFKYGEVDYERLKRLIDFHVENETDALIIAGTTGEASTLSKDEKKALYEFSVNYVDGRLPVIVGTGGNNTKDVIELSKFAEAVGCDGLLIVTPYYNKTTQEGLIKHFTVIADSVSIPIIMYNVPSRTGLNMKPSTVEKLSVHPNIAGIKEASGDITQITEIAKYASENFYLYSGNDDHILPVLALGGKGVISVVANILPKDVHDLCFAYFLGNIDKAREIQLNLFDLIRLLFIETNPIPVKEAMALLGLDTGEVRLPLIRMTKKNKELLINEMKNLGLL